MTEDYKHQITQRVRDAVSSHIERLKQDHPELLLTKQWRLFWPKGFQEGMNCIPIVTSSKQGQYLVGEVQFVLPPSMELDPEAIDLKLKDEPYQETQPAGEGSASADDPLDLLNDLVSGINDFLESLSSGRPRPGRNPIFEEKSPLGNGPGKPLTVHGPWEPGSIKDSTSIEETKRQMRRSPYLPDWFESIQSREVADDLLRRLAEGYLHYQRQIGRSISLEEYFERYTSYLKQEKKVHPFCPYKGRAIILDHNDHCQEVYCSKKPYHSQCQQVSLRFGDQPED